jgi:23S rRNA-/tRNA-specific pseudouridylate synthase
MPGLFFGYNPAMPHHPLTADNILFRDDRLLILNKPAGVPVHGGR